MTKLVPGANDFFLLQPLQWNTQYEVEITARNVKGLSEPTFVKFSMPQKPDITGTRTSTTHAKYGSFSVSSVSCDKLSLITYSTSSTTHSIYCRNYISPVIIKCFSTHARLPYSVELTYSARVPCSHVSDSLSNMHNML